MGAMLPHGRQEAPTRGASGPTRPGEGSRPGPLLPRGLAGAADPKDSMSLAARHWESAAVTLYFVSTRSRTGLISHYGTLGPNQDPLLFFSNLRTEEHRLRQAKALLLMCRTCNL
jgi:hypothetical protein